MKTSHKRINAGTVSGLMVAMLALFLPGPATGDAGRERDSVHLLDVRFIDAATGSAVRPEVIRVTGGEGAGSLHDGRSLLGADGGVTLSLPPGPHVISVEDPNYRAFAATVDPLENDRRLRFVLETLEKPERLQPEYIRSFHRSDATVFVGFVVDGGAGVPLGGVRVRSRPSGVETETGDDGFFQLSVPLPARDEGVAPALAFEKPGYENREYRNIELWPNGDWTVRVRLKEGEGTRITDEEERRGRLLPRDPYDPDAERLEDGSYEMGRNRPDERESHSVGGTDAVGFGFLESAKQEGTVVRVPRNVRVLLDDDETVEYVPMELYVRRSLPSEWIANWAGFDGGEHSLNAGAVAIRTYAIGWVNNPRAADHDICATAACQVYGDWTHTYSDAAVSDTAHHVMVNSNNAITHRMTEYSAENNSLGFACGDGYTSPSGGCLSDPVCTGEERFGHGRGLCQWGSARWATGRRFPGRDMSDPSEHDYPVKDWIEILEHYYPDFELVQGAPLEIGDFVTPAISGLAVRECPGGGIESGVNCPQLATKSPGSIGTIVDGPVLATGDGRGQTWWKVVWDDDGETTGWSAENWLERGVPPPPEPAPGVDPVADGAVHEGATLTFTVSATPSEQVWPVTDFEAYSTSAANGTVLFRSPRFSGSTDGLLDGTPNVAAVTDTFPGGNDSSRALHVAWSWNASSNPWLRLTTSNTANIPNPVVDFTRRFRFRVHTDRDLKIALGLRETGPPSDTPIGADGGTTGPIEFVGAPDKDGPAPNPSRTVDAGEWTALEFDIPNEPVSAFTGDGTLSMASVLGVLEHLAFVPADGIGEYNVYLDDFVVFEPRTLTFSLDEGAPEGAEIDPVTGVFSWSPTEADGPGTYSITVRVTDDNSPPQSAAETFEVTVAEPLSIQNVAREESGIRLTWNSIEGHVYRIQYKTDLSDPEWIDIEPGIAAEGPTASSTVAADTARKFFRILTLEGNP